MPGAKEPWSYRFPLWFALRFIVSFLAGRQRDLEGDAAEVFPRLRPLPLARDSYHIPAQGPFLVVANHYERLGLGVLWSAWFISLVMAQRRQHPCHLHWVMTSEWERLRIAGVNMPVPRWLFRRIFARFARLYDLIIMPSDPGQTMQRAMALRKAEAVLLGPKRGDNGPPQGEPVGFFPEGPTANTALHEAMPGTGLFFLRVCQKGVPLLPVGITEEEGVLTVTFGPPFFLSQPPGQDRALWDRLARDQVMIAIGKLLPGSMWGFYQGIIQQSLERA